MTRTAIHRQWANDGAETRFRTGVSLHSHTLHSKEGLDFLQRAARHCAPLGWALRRAARPDPKRQGVSLDFARGWWTPPLAPADAYQLEAKQVEGLGLNPIVSLTDHDDIEAPMSLQAIEAGLEVPVSVEWTVPYRETFFHIGVHNLPSAMARPIMKHLEGFTARPVEADLENLLHTLAAFPSTLIVFNHPLWDEKGIGEALHRGYAGEFTIRYAQYIHALEINGLRPWRESRDVIRFAAERELPVVAGGDRHTLEPNVTLNLTNARTFSEFADEVRTGKQSDVWLAEAYRRSHSARIFQLIMEVFRTYPEHGLGWSEWTDRVFFPSDSGAALSLTECWGSQPPVSIAAIGATCRLAGQPQLRSALDWILPNREEALL